MFDPFQSITTYRKKNQYLLGGTVLLLVLIGWVSIRPTWALYKESRQLVEEQNRAATAPAEIARYQQQLANLKASTPQPFQRALLLEQVTSFCRQNNLLITAFPEAHQNMRSNYSVLTHEIEVEGAYRDMVRLVYLLEQEATLGVVSSLQFHRFKDRATKKQKLRAKLVLRNLEG
ncbi:MAG: hypothetical protein AAGD05_10375 [Bacteroidota bacterium]